MAYTPSPQDTEISDSAPADTNLANVWSVGLAPADLQVRADGNFLSGLMAEETEHRSQIANLEQTYSLGSSEATQKDEEQWILLCISYQGIVKVVHMAAPQLKDDHTLFMELRKEYFKRRSACARFCELKSVRKIHFAMVGYSCLKIKDSINVT